MGLWLKQEDGSLVEVSGGGGGGTFDGEHVLTGDPSDPAVVELVDEGQLLYDGVEGGGGGGGSEPHDHDDYLPLSGGALTGPLQTTGLVAKANGPSSSTNPNISFGTEGVNAQTGFYRNSTGAVQVAAEGTKVARFGKDTITIYNDLQVDGKIDLVGGSTSKIANYGTAGSERLSLFAADSASTGAAIRLYGDGDSTSSAGRLQFLTGGAERMRITLAGRVTVAGDLQVGGVIIGGGLFSIADGIDTADVLDRAETATMPAPDDEGVATADVDGLTVNEVMTALLLKVKELSAEIKELKGA